MKAVTYLLALGVHLFLVAVEKYMEWGCRTIRFGGIIRCMSVVGLASWMMSKINIFSWDALSPSEVHNQLLSLVFWGLLGTVFLSRIIAGIMTNVELTNRRFG